MVVDDRIGSVIDFIERVMIWRDKKWTITKLKELRHRIRPFPARDQVEKDRLPEKCGTAWFRGQAGHWKLIPAIFRGE